MVAPIRTSNDLRVENRRRVIEALRAFGPCSRADLGQATGLSAAAISSFASELVNDGTVSTIRRVLGRGRPQSVLTLNAQAALGVSVSLTIDELELQLIDYLGAVRERETLTLNTRALNGHALVERVLSSIARLLSAKGPAPLRHVAVGFQGVTSGPSGRLVWSPILSVTDVPLGEQIAKNFGVSVSVDNDCRLIADALHGNPKSPLGSSFATVLFSEGVGLALTLNDQAFTGINTSALEFGHTQHVPPSTSPYRELDAARLCRCGQYGCIEAYASDYGIMRALERERVSPANETTTNITHAPAERLPASALEDEARAAAAGDAAAVAAFGAAGSAIGHGLRNLFILLGTMPVALVGRSDVTLDAMRPEMRAAMEPAGPHSKDLENVQFFTYSDDQALLRSGLIGKVLAGMDQQLARPYTCAALAPQDGGPQ